MYLYLFFKKYDCLILYYTYYTFMFHVAQSAYLKFTGEFIFSISLIISFLLKPWKEFSNCNICWIIFVGEMLEAFIILTDSMYAKGEEKLLSYGKFNQTFSEAADE